MGVLRLNFVGHECLFLPLGSDGPVWSLGLLGCTDGVVDRLRDVKQYEALQVQLDEAELENTELRLARQDAEISNRELEGKLSRLTGENDAADEANMLGTELQQLRDEVSRLTDLNEALTSQSSGRLSDIAEENASCWRTSWPSARNCSAAKTP